ncbi:hypothetical protein D8Y22_09835 [Salinadaptatus halalkaliphilus]|uniref:PGF-pre-PGF domain-containing protein n=1 Tax=Salinadaptatus halalkaliphilus TaxID=2419781 RepID=A0A4S3TL83_9EURY|nr:hypothetical protein [Salinadaptatus halalkaliphilus]THE64911.1 hypothetical protein D8Y22_09835 [Salinadaptatus halalkaliphilus]
MSHNWSTVLAVVAVLIVGALAGPAGAAVAGTASASTVQQSADSYVVEQGEFCEPIEPLSSSGSVEAFYDYRDHDTHPDGVDRMYSSYGTEHLQESDTSLLFLHQGTDGTSLVMVHDELEGDTAGGVVTFEMAGVPHDAEWVVRNDDYDGDTNRDEFETGDGWASADWAYIQNRTGGGALNGGFDDEFAVTIHPGFNEDANLYDAEVDEEFDDENRTGYGGDWWDGGDIEDWEVLSGDAEDPDRGSIPSMDEPVTIRTGTCDGPSVTYERTDDGITVTIDDVRADDTVSLQPTRGTHDGVRFERLETTGLADDTTLTFENDRPSGVSAGDLEGSEALSTVTVTGDDPSQGSSSTVTFSVDSSELDELGIDPDEIALYEVDDDGAWNVSTTEVRADQGGSYQYDAEVDSLEALAVGPHPDAGSVDASPLAGFEVGLTVAIVVLIALFLGTRARRR